jgi:co-chaperonin GroES (HSP10)
MEINSIHDFHDSSPISILPMFQTILDAKNIDGSFNYIEIDGGLTVPDEGYSIHDQDELSIVIKGRLEVTIENKIYQVKTGDYTLIRQGVPHITKNLDNEKCIIISLLI